MNTSSPTELPELPEITGEAIARMEREVFTAIRTERDTGAQRSRRRRRTTWWTVSAAAAVVVVAAVIAPSVQGLVTGSSGGSISLTDSAVAPALESAGDAGARSDEIAGTSTSFSAEGTDAVDREIITTARATVEVTDAEAAVTTIGDDAAARGGYVESMTVAGSGVVSQDQTTVDGGMIIDPSMPYYGGSNWITVRVPTAELAAAIAELSSLGDVQSSAIDRTDVTEQAVDLRARIGAAEASVARLTELMSQAGSVADLIAAEQALSERQATLESYQQQLTALESQVSLSSLTVSLVEPAEAVTPDPAGFGDGLAAGWNGLLATLNGIVIALGFLLPWLIIAGAAAGLVWGIRRLVKRRRAARTRVE